MEISNRGYIDTKHVFAEKAYYSYLKSINNVTFTRREIDIIASLLSGRSSKKIASLLSISPKTIENHIRNIMLKLVCNSRGSIIDFIEKSVKFVHFNNHYSNLLIKAAFESELKKIATPIKNNLNCPIIYYNIKRTKDLFISKLEKHLNFAGIKTCSELWKVNMSKSLLFNKVRIEQPDYLIYVMTSEFIERFDSTRHDIKEELSVFMNIFKKDASHIIFLLLDDRVFSELGKKIKISDFTYIDLTKEGNYYFLVLELLKKILLANNLNKNIDAFKKQHKTMVGHFSA